MDYVFLAETFTHLLTGVPLTIALAALSLLAGFVLAVLITALRRSSVKVIASLAEGYVFVIRGTPLLVQLFIVYYGLSQFEWVRSSILWPLLRQPFNCAVIALAANTAAYTSEVMRGALQAVPQGQKEAGLAIGMSQMTLWLRVIAPIALRLALPAYGNELILMIKATSLASIITLLEITGLAAQLISQSFRSIEVFACAGVIYLALNYAIVLSVRIIENLLAPRTTVQAG